MATLTRTNSRATGPAYKDYVNFLGGYKNSKNSDDNSDSGVSVKSFSLSSSSTSTSSSSIASDIPDFSKNTCTPFNTYLENSRTKKFNPVKANFEEKIAKNDQEENSAKNDEKVMKKSEIFIEIQGTKSVSEVSKIFETKDRKSQAKGAKINSKINIFEKLDKPKLADKPLLISRTPPPKIDILPPTPPPSFETSPLPSKIPPPKIETVSNLLIEPKISSPPKYESELPPPPPPMPAFTSTRVETRGGLPPPPHLPPTGLSSVHSHGVKGGLLPPMAPKLQATLTKGPQTTYRVNNPNGILPTEIDRNDPLVRKLVYGTLRGMYGAYHEKATDMLSSLPANMVVKSNGVQDRIEQIASNGDLDKLNGRVNPKLEQE